MNTSETATIFDLTNVTGCTNRAKVMRQPTKDSHAPSSSLLQTVRHQHGSLYTLSDDMCLLFDIPVVDETVKAGTNDFIVTVQDELGQNSVKYMRKKVLDRLKHVDEDWRMGTAEAWTCRAGCTTSLLVLFGPRIVRSTCSAINILSFHEHSVIVQSSCCSVGIHDLKLQKPPNF